MPKLKNSNATFWVIFKHCVLMYVRTKCYNVSLYSLWSCCGSLAVAIGWSTHADASFGIIILTGAQCKEGNVVESLIIRKLSLERIKWGKFQDMKTFFSCSTVWPNKFFHRKSLFCYIRILTLIVKKFVKLKGDLVNKLSRVFRLL